ncbi:polysaccharide biosynthesis protein [Carnobacterium viridans]|uniref:Membrane protein involved in the export of O-antigen and teichoic acid n=1 Tax=Carnobacterium viridans TaxID=174587 RepID=A0A1H1B1H7_9LACT|nr:polysaccharide biosynthesis protein [Carnobacterium viridans]UDE95972.1 polysaccharide biosynthesis protein [Carnobacterium viridans]SDQ45805.1 Membrane protein involved in the export of O-antigen and teichoic acid [Carnobacterium viridans]
MSKDTVSDNKIEQPIKEISSKDKMINGSAWMTGGSILSRLLGALYIIPWMAWMGNQDIAESANALYTIGYTPYALFLNIATAGVPSAIAKQVAYYNSLNEYEISRNIYKKGLQIMAITGVVSALVMYVAAPFIAASSPNISVDNATQVIRSLSWALLIIPCMSVTRGYIQGHHVMKYSAISQFIEQLARVIFMLAAVFLIRQVWNGSVVNAVAASTFAAVIGAVFSIGYLFYIIWRKKPELDERAGQSLNKVSISTTEIFKSIIRTAVPFIIIGSGITLFQMIDQFTFQQIMTSISELSPKQIVNNYGVASGNVNKLIMIVISFGGSMAITSVPLISELVAKNDLNKIARQISDSLQLFFFIMLPASIGMMIVAEPLYTVFYGHSDFGTTVLQVASFMSLFLGLFVLMGSTMQAANQTRPALWALVIGLVVKLGMQYPMLALAGTNGMFLSNIFGFGVTVLLMLRKMYKVTRFDVGLIFRRVLLMLIITLAMAVVTFAVKEVLYLVIDPKNRTSALLVMGISAGFGGLVYMYASLKTRLADRLLGARVANMRTKLRIK